MFIMVIFLSGADIVTFAIAVSYLAAPTLPERPLILADRNVDPPRCIF
jgi:hypothetical protein